MAVTKIADVVSRTGFSKYAVQRAVAVNKFVTAGILKSSTLFDDIAANGGALQKMPFWNTPNGDSDIISETTSSVAVNFSTGYDQARLHFRSKEWGRTGLSVQLAGSDPFTELGDFLGNYWSTEINKIAINSLKGAFTSGSSLSGSINDISALVSGSELISSLNFVDTLGLLGDSADNDDLSIVMHSAVKNYLVKLDLIEDYVQGSTVNTTMPIFMGHKIVVDDALSATNGIYNTYVCGQGSMALGFGKPDVEDEAFRDPELHTEKLISRRYMIVHPLGIRWNEASVAAESPTYAEMATAANWTKVYDTKNIRIVKLAHKIG